MFLRNTIVKYIYLFVGIKIMRTFAIIILYMFDNIICNSKSNVLQHINEQIYNIHYNNLKIMRTRDGPAIWINNE